MATVTVTHGVTQTVTAVTPDTVTQGVTCTVTAVTSGGVTPVTRHRHPAPKPAGTPVQGTAVTPTVTTDTVTPSPKEPAMTTTTVTRPADLTGKTPANTVGLRGDDRASRYPAIHGGPTLKFVLILFAIALGMPALTGFVLAL
jgi:hypothetical protein